MLALKSVVRTITEPEYVSTADKGAATGKTVSLILILRSLSILGLIICQELVALSLESVSDSSCILDKDTATEPKGCKKVKSLRLGKYCSYKLNIKSLSVFFT